MRRLVVPLIALLVTACAQTPPTTPVRTTPTPSAVVGATPTPSPSSTSSATTPTAKKVVLVYYVVDTSRGPRLVREPREVDAAYPARGAVEAIIAGPNDPDYGSAWPKDTRVLGINHRDHVITVDLSGEARKANVGAAFEGAMVGQLIWTLTDLLEPTASVMVTIEGKPAGDAWGHILWDKPVKRGNPMDERLLIGIDSLAQGATVTSPLEVRGEGSLFEATYLWKVTRPDGSVAAQGHAMSSEGQVFSPWLLTLTLPPGAYTLEVAETDPSGGEGTRKPDTDTRSFTVR